MLLLAIDSSLTGEAGIVTLLAGLTLRFEVFFFGLEMGDFLRSKVGKSLESRSPVPNASFSWAHTSFSRTYAALSGTFSWTCFFGSFSRHF